MRSSREFQKKKKKSGLSISPRKRKSFTQKLLVGLERSNKKCNLVMLSMFYFQYHGNHDGVLLRHKVLTNEALMALHSG